MSITLSWQLIHEHSSFEGNMAEQGTKLFEKLTQLQYPNINKFSSASFDWLFDIEDVKPFLDWFCFSVKNSNLVSDLEIKE